MKARALLLLGLAAAGSAAGPSARHTPPTPDSYRYAHQLVPAVVGILDRISQASLLEKRRPEYAAVAAGKDEYVYHLSDHVFIRCIKDRYEAPTWKICGDFAVVRVEIMDSAMKNLAPIVPWYMVYRDDQWQRLRRDEEGRFLRENYQPAELPPYAVRCFDLNPAGGRP